MAKQPVGLEALAGETGAVKAPTYAAQPAYMRVDLPAAPLRALSQQPQAALAHEQGDGVSSFSLLPAENVKFGPAHNLPLCLAFAWTHVKARTVYDAP